MSAARIKSTELQSQLSQKSSHCNQLTSEVSALSVELESSQNAYNKLQSSLSAIQSKLDLNSKEIEILTVEKEELQTRLNSILNDLDFAHKKLEMSGKEKSEHVHMMAIKDQQLLEVEAEKSKVSSELRENKAVVQNMQENLHKIVDEKNATIFKLKQDNLTTVAELTIAEKKIEIIDKELLKLRSQLEDSNDSFLKEKRSLTEELSNATEHVNRLSSEVVKKGEVLADKELELSTFKSENDQLTSELSITMDKLHQANVSVEKLQSQLVTLTKEFDAKTRFVTIYLCVVSCMHVTICMMFLYGGQYCLHTSPPNLHTLPAHYFVILISLRYFETLENDMLVVKRHIESLNHKMKNSSTDHHLDEVALDDTEQECQIVKLLNTIQQEVYDVTDAKRNLEVQVSSLSEQKKSNERYYYYISIDLKVKCNYFYVSRKLQKLEQEVDSLRVDLSQVTALKEELSNEACQLREKYEEEVSSLLMYLACVYGCSMVKAFKRFPCCFCF